MPSHRKEPSRGTASASRRTPKRPHAPASERDVFLDRWPFRRKLDVLVFVPVLVIAGMLCFVAYQQVGQARSAAQTARTVRDSEQVAKLIDSLQTEHRQALLLSLRYETLGPSADAAPDTAPYHTAQESVNTQVAEVRSAFGVRLPEAEGQALKGILGLDSLRQTVEEGPLPADNIDPAYDRAVAELIDGLGMSGPTDDGRSSADDPDEDYGDDEAGDEDGAGTGTGDFAGFDLTPGHAELSGISGTLLDSLLRADTAHASLETSVFAARTGDPNALIEYNSAVGADNQYTYQADRFRRYATRSQGSELSTIERTSYQHVIQEHYDALRVDPSSLVAESPAEVQSALKEALRDEPTYALQASERLRVVGSLIGQIASQTQQASHDAWWRAGVLLVSALLAFAAWLLFSVLTRRSVLRTVRALTTAAQRVAEATGRELARVADDDAADTGPPRLAAVPVPVRDEIGELAEAFNQVQVTATALLERQVLSRRNIAEMFGNVGRRVSNLTARQLSLIDAVERGETDPDVLERLYRIDHIAVRLQRNADSLMLLAGLREPGLTGGPVRLSNVVRAALGQIEAYQRVMPRANGDVTISPDVVGDLTLMLAELLENAVTFSPASTRVQVMLRPGPQPPAPSDDAGPDPDAPPGPDAAPDQRPEPTHDPHDPHDPRRLDPHPDGAVVEIVDHGLGMSNERLAEENARLVRRERLDLVPTKVLGLFVVGALSRRWGIKVTLKRTPGGGVTATVVVPAVHLLPTTHPVPPVRPKPHVSDSTTGGPLSPRPSRVEPPSDDHGGLPRRVPARAVRGGAGGEERGGSAGVSDGDGGLRGAGARDADFGGGEGDEGGGGAGSGSGRRGGRSGPAWARPSTDAPGAADVPGAPGAPDTVPSDPLPSGAGARAQVPGARAPHPLRRRVRGATLSATTASSVPGMTNLTVPERGPRSERPGLEDLGGRHRGPQNRGPEGWRARDAEAARLELDEFEAAVARAQRDSLHLPSAPYRPTAAEPPAPPARQAPPPERQAPPTAARPSSHGAPDAAPHGTPPGPAAPPPGTPSHEAPPARHARHTPSPGVPQVPMQGGRSHEPPLPRPPQAPQQSAFEAGPSAPPSHPASRTTARTPPSTPSPASPAPEGTGQ